MTLLIDASVLLATVDAGPLRAAARALLTGGFDLVALDHAAWEIARIEHARKRRGECSEAAALATLDVLPHLCRWVATTPALVRRGVELAFELGVSPADGLWLAATESLDAQLVTADAALYQSTRNTAFDARIVTL